MAYYTEKYKEKEMKNKHYILCIITAVLIISGFLILLLKRFTEYQTLKKFLIKQEIHRIA